ncbi:MAG: hypothetical protein J7L82_00830, partial [Staphylothermus sp.]|nr:hypothetical protein [Staphylothermus sp.]
TNTITLQQLDIPNIAVLIVGAISVGFLLIRIDLSYIFLMLSAIIGLVQLSLHTSITENEIYTGFIYILIFITATTYLHTIRTVKSKEYLSKIKELATKIEKLSTIEEQKVETPGADDQEKELYERALELYRKLYGSNAEKLLNYTINIMIMHGFKRKEALEKNLKNLQ